MLAIDLTELVVERLSPDERRSKQPLNAGVEMEFASDKNTEEITQALNQALGSKTAFGNQFKFVSSDQYANMTGKNRDWLVSVDSTAAKPRKEVQIGGRDFKRPDKKKRREAAERLAQDFQKDMQENAYMLGQGDGPDRLAAATHLYLTQGFPYKEQWGRAGPQAVSNAVKNGKGNPTTPEFWDGVLATMKVHKDWEVEEAAGEQFGKNGIEIGSPRLSLTEKTAPKIAKAVSAILKTVQGITHDKSGLHVHVSLPADFDSIHQLRLAKIASNADRSGMNKEVSGRDHNEWAGDLGDMWGEMARHAQGIASASSGSGGSKRQAQAWSRFLKRVKTSFANWTPDKYTSANFRSPTKLGTVEFRMAGSQLAENPEALEKWLTTVSKMVRTAAGGSEVTMDAEDGGGKFVLRMGPEGMPSMSYRGTDGQERMISDSRRIPGMRKLMGQQEGRFPYDSLDDDGVTQDYHAELDASRNRGTGHEVDHPIGRREEDLGKDARMAREKKRTLGQRVGQGMLWQTPNERQGGRNQDDAENFEPGRPEYIKLDRYRQFITNELKDQGDIVRELWRKVNAEEIPDEEAEAFNDGMEEIGKLRQNPQGVDLKRVQRWMTNMQRYGLFKNWRKRMRQERRAAAFEQRLPDAIASIFG